MTIADSLLRIARELKRQARVHPVVALVVAFLCLSSAAYAIPPVRRGVHRAARAVRYFFVRRQMFLLRDLVRTVQTPGTISVRQRGDVVLLSARPLAPWLVGRRTYANWMLFDVIPPTLLHDLSADRYRGDTIEIDARRFEFGDVVVMVLVADADNIDAPGQAVPDEAVQVDYVGLRMRDRRIEVFDADSLVPEPRPPKDRRQLIFLDFTVTGTQ